MGEMLKPTMQVEGDQGTKERSWALIGRLEAGVRVIGEIFWGESCGGIL